jgi:hypothetical protein
MRVSGKTDEGDEHDNYDGSNYFHCRAGTGRAAVEPG